MNARKRLWARPRVSLFGVVCSESATCNLPIVDVCVASSSVRPLSAKDSDALHARHRLCQTKTAADGPRTTNVPRLSWTLFGFMHALSGLVVPHSLTAGSFVTFLSCCKPNLRGEIIASRGSEATADLSDLPNRPPNHHHHSSHVCRQNPLFQRYYGCLLLSASSWL